MARTQAAVVRPFVAAVVLAVLLGASACGPLQQAGPDPLKFGSAQHFLRTDLVKMSLDLGRERNDARSGPNGRSGLPSCYNLIQNVNVEVARMDSFASGTVAGDITAMQDDVAEMRAERTDFERDINDFVNDGVLRPANEPFTIAAINRKIADAVRHADATITAIVTDLRSAHTTAGGLATAACASDAPRGAPPISLVH